MSNWYKMGVYRQIRSTQDLPKGQSYVLRETPVGISFEEYDDGYLLYILRQTKRYFTWMEEKNREILRDFRGEFIKSNACIYLLLDESDSDGTEVLFHGVSFSEEELAEADREMRMPINDDDDEYGDEYDDDFVLGIVEDGYVEGDYGEESRA